MVGILNAHVGLNYPQGGQTFFVGDTVEIKWQNIIIHNPIDWDLYFSPDGGVSWQQIELNLPITQFDYQWVVPNVVTDSAQIRIVQDNVGDDYEDQSLNFTIEVKVLGISESSELPTVLNLISNFPNPFNPTTTIKYDISQASQVTVIIYDMLGNEIIQLDKGVKEAGEHFLKWQGVNDFGNRVSAGTYLYRIQADQFFQVKKMVLMK
ncbi:FlgD immunoglobulin-like domain containing protein [Candidatus Neomarinimicrobiota bacterium]